MLLPGLPPLWGVLGCCRAVGGVGLPGCCMNTVASVGGLVAWGPDGMLQCLLWCGGSCCCHSSVRSMSWSELAVLLALP